MSRDRLFEAARFAEAHRATLGEALVQCGYVDDMSYSQALATYLVLPQVNPSQLANVPTNVIALVPSDVAIEHRIVPLSFDKEGTLVVAMSEPSNQRGLDELNFFISAYIVRVVASPSQVAWALRKYYDHVCALAEATNMPTATAPGQTLGLAAAPALAPPAEATPPPAAPLAPPAETRPPAEPAPSGVVQAIESEPQRLVPAPSEPVTIRRPATPTVTGEMSLALASERLRAYEPSIVIDETQLRAESKSEAKVIVAADLYDAVPRAVTEPVSGEIEALAAADAAQPANGTAASVEIDATLLTSRESVPVLLTDKIVGSTIVSAPDLQASEPIMLELAPANALPAPLAPSAEPTARLRRGTAPGLGVRSESVPGRATTPLPVTSDVGALTNDIETAPQTPLAMERKKVGGEASQGTFPSDAVLAISDASSGPMLLPAIAGISRDEASWQAPDPARALEDATAKTFQLLAELEHAGARNEVIEKLIVHAAWSHRDTVFFIVRHSGQHHQLMLFAMHPRAVPAPVPSLDLIVDTANACKFRDVVEKRLPYRGPLPDVSSQALAMACLGRVPTDMLVLPILVRGRVVGLWCASERTGTAYDEQFALVARAAGASLERILRAKHEI